LLDIDLLHGGDCSVRLAYALRVKRGGHVVVLAVAGLLGGGWACGAATGVGILDEAGSDGDLPEAAARCACDPGLACSGGRCIAVRSDDGSFSDSSDAAFDEGAAAASDSEASRDSSDAAAPDGEASRGDGSTGCVPPPSGIVSWWTGDNTFADLEGRNPGTANGSVAFVAGEVGDAFVFDGASAVTAATNDFPVGDADRTIELWVYLSSSVGIYPSLTEMFVQYGTFGTSGAAFALFTYGTPPLYWSQWGASVAGGSMSTGVWTHVAATSTAGTITLFEDGKAVASGAVSPYDTPAGTTLFIGGQGPDPQGKMDRLTGRADEVTVYNRALSQTEIASIYAAGRAGKCH
jgi:hypothetical protein